MSPRSILPPGLEFVTTEVTEHQSWGCDTNDPEWMAVAQTKLYTNVFVFDEGKVLLGLKKRGVGINLYNGFGGKVEPGESIDEAAHRELKEEAGIEADLTHAGTLLFLAEDWHWAFRIEIYRSQGYQGTFEESEEMIPQLFDLSDIPYDKMWEGDRFWLPLVIEKHKFVARVDFGTIKGKEGSCLRKWWIGMISEGEPIYY